MSQQVKVYRSLEVGWSAAPNNCEAGTPVVQLYTTSSNTSSTNTEPFYMKSVMTGAGGYGGRARFHAYTNVAVGSNFMGLKSMAEFGSSGSCNGLATGLCSEIVMPNAAVGGTYYAIELEYVAGGTSTQATDRGWIYLNNTGDAAGDFDTNGFFFRADGLTAGSGSLLSVSSQTLKCSISGSTTRYMVLSTTEDILGLSRTLTSQSTENDSTTLALTTDSTFIGGSNMTYSGGYGSAVLKLTGAFSGATGGFSALYANVTSTGSLATDGNGVIGVKCVVTNSAAVTDGEMYGAQFIAKHSHASNDMGKSASLIGLEGWCYDASTGTVGTMIGGNFGYHNECTTTQETGSVHRGVQIFCDDASGAQNATESEALCLWNMAGTQARAINVVQSGSGFTNFVRFASAAAPISSQATALNGLSSAYKIACQVGSTTFYLIGLTSFGG